MKNLNNDKNASPGLKEQEIPNVHIKYNHMRKSSDIRPFIKGAFSRVWYWYIYIYFIIFILNYQSRLIYIYYFIIF